MGFAVDLIQQALAASPSGAADVFQTTLRIKYLAVRVLAMASRGSDGVAPRRRPCKTKTLAVKSDPGEELGKGRKPKLNVKMEAEQDHGEQVRSSTGCGVDMEEDDEADQVLANLAGPVGNLHETSSTTASSSRKSSSGVTLRGGDNESSVSDFLQDPDDASLPRSQGDCSSDESYMAHPDGKRRGVNRRKASFKRAKASCVAICVTRKRSGSVLVVFAKRGGCAYACVFDEIRNTLTP